MRACEVFKITKQDYKQGSQTNFSAGSLGSLRSLATLARGARLALATLASVPSGSVSCLRPPARDLILLIGSLADGYGAYTKGSGVGFCTRGSGPVYKSLKW